ncbi:uroporphyrinogen-III C-methyltransferase [Pseudomonas entomophila]|uniref:uroporphyrinogen-III C-methyltransferase n=1 Tax=Pseudomonas sp. RIT-PI-S TaxID=3035295 RepID=UPI0021DB7AD6
MPVRSRTSQGLAVLALLIGACGLGVGGWAAWQLRQLDAGQRQQGAQVQSLASANQAIGEQARSLDARLSQLPAADELEDRRRLVAQLQSDQQRLGQRLETVLGASRQDWRLAEAEHLVRLASLRLSALQDVNSARALVQGADDILREQDDPNAFAAREQLARSLAALQATEQPDRTGLFLQLAALREQAAQLSALAPQFEADREAVSTASDDSTLHWRQWWARISSFFRIDFNPDANVRPLLAGQGLNQVRLALRLALEQAQWAALNGEQAVFKQALGQAREILIRNFNQDNTQSSSLLASLDKLASSRVTVATPDLANSLAALQAYMARRHQPGGGPGGEQERQP